MKHTKIWNTFHGNQSKSCEVEKGIVWGHTSSSHHPLRTKIACKICKTKKACKTIHFQACTTMVDWMSHSTIHRDTLQAWLKRMRYRGTWGERWDVMSSGKGWKVHCERCDNTVPHGACEQSAVRVPLWAPLQPFIFKNHLRRDTCCKNDYSII